MSAERIEQLLKRADAAAPAETKMDAGVLADGVLNMRHRRRRRRITVGAAVVVLLVGSISAWIVRPTHRDALPIVSVSDLASGTLTKDIEATEQNLRRMIAAERLAQAEARLEELSQVPTPKDVAERAAKVLVTQADRLARTSGLTESAERAYSDVIERLPDTASATIARQRIAELRKEG